MRKLAAVLPLLVVALALGACGGDDASEPAASTTSTTTEPTPDPQCATLAELPYEARKTAIDELGDDRDVDEDDCGELIEATEEAAALQALTSSITPDTAHFDLLQCEADGIVLEVTNASDAPMHLLGITAYFDVDDDANESDAFSYVNDDGETIERDATHETTIAAARQGNDGAWRLLTPALSLRHTPCAAVDEVITELRDADLLPAGADVDGLQTLEEVAALPGLSDSARTLVLERIVRG